MACAMRLINNKTIFLVACAMRLLSAADLVAYSGLASGAGDDHTQVGTRLLLLLLLLLLLHVGTTRRGGLGHSLGHAGGTASTVHCRGGTRLLVAVRGRQIHHSTCRREIGLLLIWDV